MSNYVLMRKDQAHRHDVDRLIKQINACLNPLPGAMDMGVKQYSSQEALMEAVMNARYVRGAARQSLECAAKTKSDDYLLVEVEMDARNKVKEVNRFCSLDFVMPEKEARNAYHTVGAFSAAVGAVAASTPSLSL